MQVKTLRTTANDCPNKWDCPSVHELDTDPERRYVVSKQASSAERDAFAHLLRPGEAVGWMPPGFLSAGNGLLGRTRDVASRDLRPDRQYVVTELVNDPAVLAEFGDLVSRNEQLGTVPVRQLAVV